MFNQLEKSYRNYISEDWSQQIVDDVTELIIATTTAMEEDHKSKGAVLTILRRVLRDKGMYHLESTLADLETKYAQFLADEGDF